MRFSIIVPVYNVQKYIARCMDSLVRQTFRDYEIILVDDESPDRSMEIAQAYVQADPQRIQVLHQKNTRQGGARNHGVREARGEYLVFVDSDDYVVPEMLEIMDRRLREQACDILLCQHIPVTETGKQLPGEAELTFAPGCYVPAEHPELVRLPGAPWAKAFRREFYLHTGFCFPEKLLYEDVSTRLLYVQAETIQVCEERVYYYVHRENSSMTQKLTPRMLDILTVTDLVQGEFQRLGLSGTYGDQVEIALIYCILCILEKINRTQWDHPMQIPMADYIQEHFPDYRKNPCASPELVRLLDCLAVHDFKTYHRRLLVNDTKDRLLQIPGVRQLNALRKKR